VCFGHTDNGLDVTDGDGHSTTCNGLATEIGVELGEGEGEEEGEEEEEEEEEGVSGV
jgi:hypothetical protein